MIIDRLIPNTIYDNNTTMFLAPVLYTYEPIIVDSLKELIKLGYFIGDTEADKNNIYILVDTFGMYSMYNQEYVNISGYKYIFNSSLKKIKESKHYVKDYILGDIAEGNYHVIVMSLNVKNENIIDDFIKGHFSKLFNLREINDVFSENQLIYNILTKDTTYGKLFLDALNEKYNSSLTMNDLDEYATKPDIKLELLRG